MYGFQTSTGEKREKGLINPKEDSTGEKKDRKSRPNRQHKTK